MDFRAVLAIAATAIFYTSGTLAGSKPVDVRLAVLVEAAVSKTGISINISESDSDSININEVNGISVCSDLAKNDVLALQSAFEENSDLRLTISIFGVTSRGEDGGLVHKPFAFFREQGIIASDCVNLYVSVLPRQPT